MKGEGVSKAKAVKAITLSQLTIQRFKKRVLLHSKTSPFAL